MGWIGSVHCEKFRSNLVARTCAIIAPVQPILHRVSCSNENLPNAPKYYEMHQNMSLGSNGVDRVRSLRKIPSRLRGTNLFINCPSSARFGQSFVQYRNNQKCIQTLQNAPIHEFRVQWGGLGAFCCEKLRCDFMAQTCALIAPLQSVLHRVSCCNEILPNAPKHYETHQNMSLGSNGVDRVCSLRKILMRLRGTNFCINCTRAANFAPSFVRR